MKQYTIEEVIKAVRTKFDEIGMNDSDMMDTDTDNGNLNTVIRSSIDPAYRFVVTSADLSMLEGKSLQAEDSMSIGEDLVAHIKLPQDFLRGITMRLSSWQSSPGIIITEETPEYRMQADPYACGTFQQPVAALVHTTGGREMELYKAKSQEDTLKSFIYAPIWQDGAETISIPDQLTEAFMYYVAGLAATTFHEDVANDFFKVARSLIGLE